MNIENKKNKDYLRYIPDFYKEILQTWIKMGGGQTKTLSHLDSCDGSMYFPFTINLSFGKFTTLVIEF
jgi:hypothetical protein